MTGKKRLTISVPEELHDLFISTADAMELDKEQFLILLLAGRGHHIPVDLLPSAEAWQEWRGVILSRLLKAFSTMGEIV